MATARVDPILLELYKHRFASICEEMGVTLQRTAFSPNIKERLDFSCALFDGAGEMVSQAAHIPVHLGSMPLTVQRTIEELKLAPGDVAMVNDPYRGGTHLPDLTVVAPVHLQRRRRPDFYVANRAHHADIGGSAPGSMAPTEELYQEGLIIPPVRIVRGGTLDADMLNLVLANLRAPEERRGDLAAQIAAINTGIARVRALVAERSRPRAVLCARALMAYAEQLMRTTLRGIPDGAYTFSDEMDDDGAGGPGPTIAVRIIIRGGAATIDFTGTADQVLGNINAVYAITVSAVYYVFRCLAPPEVPSNAGIGRPLTIVAPEGSLVNARFPAGVAGGNVETSQRIVDVLLGALAQACPDRVPAASAGTMTNFAFGGVHPGGRPFTYYETVAGGLGARPDRPGVDGIQTHMTNTMNTPIEALEHTFPVLVERYGVRRGSGGRGKYRGGAGLVRTMRFTAPATVSLLADRHRTAPYGLRGGGAGKPGAAFLLRDGRKRRLPSKCQFHVYPGDAVELHTPGGGGWGRRRKRPR